MWLYLGLVAPSGTAFARPVSSGGRASPDRVLLVGGDDAEALAPSLKRLAAEDDVAFDTFIRSGTNAVEWAIQRWLEGAVESSQPSTVIIALTPMTLDRCGELEGHAGPARVLWMPVAGEASERVLPRTSVPGWPIESAKGYAAWAAAAWRVVR